MYTRDDSAETIDSSGCSSREDDPPHECCVRFIRNARPRPRVWLPVEAQGSRWSWGTRRTSRGTPSR